MIVCVALFFNVAIIITQFAPKVTLNLGFGPIHDHLYGIAKIVHHVPHFPSFEKDTNNKYKL
jgi:hypothetical protein